MTLKARWSVALLVAAVLATIATLPVRGWDEDKKLVGTIHCSDTNADYTKDQFPPTLCLEGHGCVFCYNIDGNPTGELVSPIGTGSKKWNPAPLTCGGVRRIGVCIGNGGLEYCDLSVSYIDGDCSGLLYEYPNQGTE